MQDINNLRQKFLTFKCEREMQTNAVVDLKSRVQEQSYLLKKKECKTPELIKVDSHPEPTHKDSYSEILKKTMPQTLNTTYKNDNSSADNFTKLEKRRRSIRIGRMKQSDVVEKLVNIFVSRFHPDVLESEIKQFAQT